MNRGNPYYYVSGGYLSLKPASVIFATSSKEDVPSPNASRHLPDQEFTSHRSASPKSPELEPIISKESSVNNVVGLSTPRVLKVNLPTWNSSELRKNQIAAMTEEGGKLVSPRVLEVTPYPIWNISQLPEDQRLEIIKKRDALLKKKSAITISDLQASSGSSASNSFSGSSILNPTMHQETDTTEVSRREETQPHNTRNEVMGTLVYATERIPEKLPPAGVLLRPEGAQVQKEKQSCFSGCIIS